MSANKREQLYAKRPVQLEQRKDGDTETSTVKGHAAVFYDGTRSSEYRLWGDTYERIMPGAFDEAVTRDDVRALFNHDENMVLGRNKAGTLRMSIDNVGLAYEVDLGNTTVARDVAEHISRGDVTGSSFGFVVTDERWVEAPESEYASEFREITAVRLFDVSPVTYPAYEATDVQLRADGHEAEARASYDAWKQCSELAATVQRRNDARVKAIQLEQKLLG